MTTDRPVIREIMTKAVCGQGTFKYQRSIDLEIPAGQTNVQVLGTFISNAALDESKVVDNSKHRTAVQVKGHYDVHVWYASEQETRSAKTTVTFIEFIPIKSFGGESISNPQAYTRIIQKPRCRKAYVKDLGDKTAIRVEVEQDLASEIVGFTKLKVGIAPFTSSVSQTVKGLELIAPSSCSSPASPSIEYYDLKCEEELPDEDMEDFEYPEDDF